MAEIIEHDGNRPSPGNEPVVRVGNGETLVSIKTYQDVYHQITGRTEQIRKRYSDNLLIEVSELQQLHFKIAQLCDIHNIVASNEVISIFHEKERKEQFTSFERFLKYNANATSPSVSVHLRYNFSIVLAGNERPQEYVVAVRLTSRVAMLKQIEEDAPPFMRGHIAGYLGGNTAEIMIDYSDYVVARGFIEAFDEWIVGCKKIPKRKWLEVLQQHSHRVPNVLKVLAALLVIFFALQAIPTFFSGPFQQVMWARFLVVYSGGAFVVINLMTSAGRFIEHAIDAYPTLSYLKLNKGDENLISEFGAMKSGVIWKFVRGCILTIIMGIITTKLELLI